jgi:hypothetical protein
MSAVRIAKVVSEALCTIVAGAGIYLLAEGSLDVGSVNYVRSLPYIASDRVSELKERLFFYCWSRFTVLDKKFAVENCVGEIKTIQRVIEPNQEMYENDPEGFDSALKYRLNFSSSAKIELDKVELRDLWKLADLLAYKTSSRVTLDKKAY